MARRFASPAGLDREVAPYSNFAIERDAVVRKAETPVSSAARFPMRAARRSPMARPDAGFARDRSRFEHDDGEAGMTLAHAQRR